MSPTRQGQRGKCSPSWATGTWPCSIEPVSIHFSLSFEPPLELSVPHEAVWIVSAKDVEIAADTRRSAESRHRRARIT